jgi:hypothetical protein
LLVSEDIPLAADGKYDERPVRIVLLGGGFGGVAAVRHLERICGGRADVEITLVSRDNFFVLTPLLFEACSGTLELRHCAQPIRPVLKRARFVEAASNRGPATARCPALRRGRQTLRLTYDARCRGARAETNESLIPGYLGGLHVQDDGRRLPEKPRHRTVRAGRRRLGPRGDARA